MIEIWKDIKNYEGFYMVSNYGNVKSCDRYTFAGKGNNHTYQHLKEHQLHLNKCGKYVQVILSKNGKLKSFGVHRLVAQAFIKNPDNLPCVNHIDENKHNNRVDNLEWCTYKYNNEYNNRLEKCKHKISQTLKGRKRNYILSDEQRKHISDGAKRGWIKRKSAITNKEEV